MKNKLYDQNSLKDKLVSVIIPTHNRSSFLVKSIDSVIAQTYKNIEIIVVSDGSTDDTDEIMKPFLKRSNIKYFINEKPRGANYTRNVGIKKASGLFIAFLDDDDTWDITKIEKQMNLFLTNDKIGLVTSGFYITYPEQNINKIYIPKPKLDSSKDILIKNVIGGTPGVIVKREHLMKSGLFDENLSALQDYDLWIRICQITFVGYINEPLVYVDHHLNRDKISNNTSKYIESRKIINSKYGELLKGLSKKENKIRNFNNNLSLSKKALRNGEKKLARKYARIAFKYKKKIKAILAFLGSFLPYKILLKINSLF
ncbi:MAG: glycosyltransferase family 2 protein [Acholeplasmatales bacterium]